MMNNKRAKGTKDDTMKNDNHHREQLPPCHSANVTRNGKKNKGKQNYRCKNCGRQFISEHERTCKGTLSWVKIMLVTGVDIQDIGVILEISIDRVLKVLKSTKYQIKPKQSHYDCTSFGRIWGKRRTKYGLFTHITGIREK
jgi:transposase-like protein